MKKMNLENRNILVIYVDSQEDTKDLELVYEGIDAVIMRNPSKYMVKDILTYCEFDTVIIMGHGSPSGLFSKSWDGYLIDESFVTLLKNKDCIGIWCYASDFARRYDLKGFFTSMFISNHYEALSCGIKSEDSEIQRLTQEFCREVNNLIKESVPFDEWIERLESKADMTNPVVKYNYEAMEYFD